MSKIQSPLLAVSCSVPLQPPNSAGTDRIRSVGTDRERVRITEESRSGCDSDGFTIPAQNEDKL
jgi:hypothetical protein